MPGRIIFVSRQNGFGSFVCLGGFFICMKALINNENGFSLKVLLLPSKAKV